MPKPSDIEIMTALCCGERCLHDGMCHRGDFLSETRRINDLLERCEAREEEKSDAA